MTDERALQQRLDALERTVNRQRLGLGALALVLGVTALTSWRTSDPEVLRAQCFVALDDHGNEVGHFGFRREGDSRAIQWSLNDPAGEAFAICRVGADPEPGSADENGFAVLQMEAGSAISQHSVRETGDLCALSFITGEDERSAVSLSTCDSISRLQLAGGPLVLGQDGKEDEARSLSLVYDEQGPSIKGVDLEGVSKIDLR